MRNLKSLMLITRPQNRKVYRLFAPKKISSHAHLKLLALFQKSAGISIYQAIYYESPLFVIF
jgi:hypothetical protein